MGNKAILQTLGKNVRALRKSLLTPEGSRSIKDFAKWTGVANGTVDRIEKATTDPQISHLLKIAGRYHSYGIRVWHLFVPDLDPANLPAWITPHERELHSAIEGAYAKLREKTGKPDQPVTIQRK